MERREFITLLSSAGIAWPLVARAQQSTMPIVGFLSSRSPGDSSEVVAAFHKGLRQMGFVEGQNTIIAFRWAEGHYDRLPKLASDLVNLRAAAIFAAGGSPTAVAAKAATATIPIVFLVSDPIRLGLVTSLNQPRGNVTGISNVATELAGKSLGLLKQTIPTAQTFGYLMNPSNPIAKTFFDEAQAAANKLGIQLRLNRRADELRNEFGRLISPSGHLCRSSFKR